MSCELSIPIPNLLNNEKELKEILYLGFGDFNKKIPKININFTKNSDINGIVHLYSDDIFCNYSISRFDKSVTEHKEYDHLVMISCRGDWLLAYIVAYCFVKKYNSYAIDDCGAIPDDKGYYKYNLIELRDVILNLDLMCLPSTKKV